MNNPEFIAIVEIICQGHEAQIERVDVNQFPMPVKLDREMLLIEIQKNHPGCIVRIIDVERVINRKQ